MRRFFSLICMTVLMFQAAYAETDYVFIDDMSDFSKIHSRSDNVIFDVIPEEQYDLFYGDYTIMQRTTLDSAYITYCVPYWETAEIEVYHYNYDVDEFTFFISEDNENYTEAEVLTVKDENTGSEIDNKEENEGQEPEEGEQETAGEDTENATGEKTGNENDTSSEPESKEISHTDAAEQSAVLISKAGSESKWQKKVYEVKNAGLKNKYFKIVWADINGTDRPNWGQAIGSVKVKTGKKVPCSAVILSDDYFIIPDEGTREYAVSAELYDQMGEKMEQQADRWNFKNLPEGVSAEGQTLEINASAPENAEITIEVYAGEKCLAFKNIRLAKLAAGDVNGDTKIDETDLSLICGAFMRKTGDAAYDAVCRGDIDKNGVIDIADISYIAKNIEK